MADTRRSEAAALDQGAAAGVAAVDDPGQSLSLIPGGRDRPVVPPPAMPPPRRGVVRSLLDSPWEFSFYQAIQLLDALDPASSVGRLGPVEKERLRFRTTASLGFAANDISGVSYKTGSEERPDRYEVTVSFLGLYGPPSPMPAHYTERVIAYELDNTNVRDFYDVFNHRLIAFSYRVWRKYRYYAEYRTGATDRFSERLYAILGLTKAHLERTDALNWIRLLPYAGLLSLYSHSASMLANIITHYFEGVPAQIEEWVPRRVRIPLAQQNRLGTRQCLIGDNMVIGESVPDCAGKFRIWLGPMSFEEFQDYLPDGRHFATLRSLVRVMLRDQLDFDLALVLREEDLPEWKLEPGSPNRLGWSMWLGEHQRQREVVQIDMRLEQEPSLF